MRTKEEIIKTLDWSTNTKLEAAFDEYAKEIAIEFGEWLDLNSDDCTTASVRELFDKYQQEKSSLK